MQSENLWALPLGGSQQREPVDFDRGRPPSVEPFDEQPERPLPPDVVQRRSYRGLIRIALILVLVIACGALLYWQRDTIGGLAGRHRLAGAQSKPANAARSRTGAAENS
jgi:hypothetical protein